jgi:phosphate transport system protein
LRHQPTSRVAMHHVPTEGLTMREVFQQELHDVQEGLAEIAALVATAIDRATRAFNDSDVALAEQVIADDAKIDQAAVMLDELAIDILARQAPVARDLRTVVSALRISASLERMGDLAEHIAQLARHRFPEKVVPKSLRDIFRQMAALDVAMADKLARLLLTEDVGLAEEIRDEDDQVDALHASVFDAVLGETWKGGPIDTVDATLASRYHERFADHAVSIAKKVQYLATGDWVGAAAGIRPRPADYSATTAVAPRSRVVPGSTPWLPSRSSSTVSPVPGRPRSVQDWPRCSAARSCRRTPSRSRWPTSPGR